MSSFESRSIWDDSYYDLASHCTIHKDIYVSKKSHNYYEARCSTEISKLNVNDVEITVEDVYVDYIFDHFPTLDEVLIEVKRTKEVRAILHGL